MREIIINQPRMSYYVGGAEMLSMDHARFLCMKGYKVRIFTIDPALGGMGYSERYLKFKDEFKKKIEFIEINLGENIKIFIRRCLVKIDIVGTTNRLSIVEFLVILLIHWKLER